MYKFIENLNEKEYENFVYNSDKAHFMQSKEWSLVQKEKKFSSHLVGIKKDNILIGTALLLEKKLLKHFSYIYCPRGFIIDYSNKADVKAFTKKIKLFSKKRKAIFFRIDPDIKLQNLDSEGNSLNSNNNGWLVDYLKKIGFKHKGFNKNFENSQPRYTFRLNIEKNIDEIFKGFHPTTRKILNKGNLYDLNIQKNNIETFDGFYETMLETAKRENIKPSSLEYYKNFYNILHKNNMSDLYTISVDINNLKKIYKNLVAETKKDIEKQKANINQEKAQKIINDLNNKLEKQKKELLVIEDIKERYLTLAAIITAKYKDKVWTVHGGNHSLLRELNANYLIYYEIIKDANKDGYKIIDFFGTTGNPIEANPIYGIHLFKKRLGGEYTEFIGEFDYINHKILYFLYMNYIKYKKRKKQR
ncbi:MAG: peptidoglycan bridge formation glycyltransferase FemA/FemB family protein [Bacilli bacterium]|nr:peptidoglycan bridge formation glycyltransferase FemA/FemB family protein [Bacilli bacterium]